MNGLSFVHKIASKGTKGKKEKEDWVPLLQNPKKP